MRFATAGSEPSGGNAFQAMAMFSPRRRRSPIRPDLVLLVEGQLLCEETDSRQSTPFENARYRISELLHRPIGCGPGDHIAMNDAAGADLHDHEYIKDTEAG